MLLWAAALGVIGYALIYAGMTGFLSLLSGGKIAKQSVLTALGITGAGGLTQNLSSGAASLNPFANAAALNVSAGTVSSNLIPQALAPAAYLQGNGQSATSPVTSATALGSEPTAPPQVTTNQSVST